MRGGFVLVILGMVLQSCSSTGNEPSPSSLYLDDVSSIAINSSKGRGDADIKASASCGRYQKTAQFISDTPNPSNPSVIVYRYACR